MLLGLSIGSAFDVAVDHYIAELPPNLAMESNINSLKKTTAKETFGGARRHTAKSEDGPDAEHREANGPILAATIAIPESFGYVCTGKARGSMFDMGWAEATHSGMGVFPCPEEIGREKGKIIGLGVGLFSRLHSTARQRFQRMTDEMALALPNYKEYLDLFQSDQRLHHALAMVYEDILGFWSQATKIFVKSRSAGT